jgi:hypothetical protein
MPCGKWKLACPKSKLQLVFPSRSDGIQHYKDIARRLEALQVETGMVDATGKPKYTLHVAAFLRLMVHQSQGARRTCPASKNRAAPARAFHDRNDPRHLGHLFVSDDDGAELAAAEQRLLG